METGRGRVVEYAAEDVDMSGAKHNPASSPASAKPKGTGTSRLAAKPVSRSP